MKSKLTVLTEQEELEYNSYLIEKFIEDELIVNGHSRQVCKKCSIEKEFSDFPKDTKCKLGIKSVCKSCQSIAKKEWASKNKAHLSAESKRYRQNNREALSVYKKNWVMENRERVSEYERIYKKNIRDTNKLFKLAGNVSSLVRGLIGNAGRTENLNIFRILGCDWATFKGHIENQFLPGMTWENREMWHLDHIYPISAAISRREVFKLSNYKNFRPMWKKDNISKSNSIIREAGVLICHLFEPNPQESIIYQLDDADSLVYHQEQILMNYFPAEKGALNTE